MILQDFIRFRKFTICRGSANQGDLVTNPGLLLGGCSAWLYLFQGDAVLSYPGGVTQVSAGLNDLRDHFGQPLEYTVKSESAAWVAFNPGIRDTSLLVTIVQAGSLELEDNELETFIVPLKGAYRRAGRLCPSSPTHVWLRARAPSWSYRKAASAPSSR